MLESAGMDRTADGVLMTQQGWCPHELTETVGAHRAPAQVHVRRGPSAERGGHEPPPLTQKLSSSVSCSPTKNEFPPTESPSVCKPPFRAGSTPSCEQQHQMNSVVFLEICCCCCCCFITFWAFFFQPYWYFADLLCL